MRLGDLDALRKQFDDIPVFIGMTGGCVQQFIDEQPTIDAVPVVRCKDCKAWTCFMNNPDGTMFGNCELCGNNFRNEDDFCSYGERKDGDTDG